jgi:hypothetical protein
LKRYQLLCEDRFEIAVYMSDCHVGVIDSHRGARCTPTLSIGHIHTGTASPITEMGIASITMLPGSETIGLSDTE